MGHWDDSRLFINLFDLVNTKKVRTVLVVESVKMADAKLSSSRR